MKTVLVILTFATLVLASCTNPRYAYSPTAHNVPLLAKQGDSKIAASYSTNGTSNATDDDNNQYDRASAHGFDVQGAVAVTNNIALQASYYNRSEKSSSTSSGYYDFVQSTVKYKRSLVEFGAGYFSAMDKRKKMFVQVYAGAGFGKTTINDHGTDQNQLPYSRFYNTNITKFYLEPSITFRPAEVFAATIATRASLIKFGSIHTDYSHDEKLNYNLDSLDRYSVAFFEPCFIGSFGFKKAPGFRIEFQVGLSVLWEEDFIDYRPFNFSVGLCFDIGKMIKGKSED